MDWCSFFLGMAVTFVVLVITAELLGRNQKNDPVSRAQECINTYNSTENTEFLREARKQLEIAIYRKERKIARQDRESVSSNEKL